MSSANFKLKRTAAASRGFLATARFSCICSDSLAMVKCCRLRTKFSIGLRQFFLLISTCYRLLWNDWEKRLPLTLSKLCELHCIQKHALEISLPRGGGRGVHPTYAIAIFQGGAFLLLKMLLSSVCVVDCVPEWMFHTSWGVSACTFRAAEAWRTINCNSAIKSLRQCALHFAVFHFYWSCRINALINALTR